MVQSFQLLPKILINSSHPSQICPSALHCSLCNSRDSLQSQVWGTSFSGVLFFPFPSGGVSYRRSPLLPSTPHLLPPIFPQPATNSLQSQSHTQLLLLIYSPCPAPVLSVFVSGSFLLHAAGPSRSGSLRTQEITPPSSVLVSGSRMAWGSPELQMQVKSYSALSCSMHSVDKNVRDFSL